MILAWWYEPPLRRGKKIEGTYWMNVRADLYSLKSDFKELDRIARQLQATPKFHNRYSDSFQQAGRAILMLSLNTIAIFYFINRIILCRIDHLRPPGFRKTAWTKRRKPRQHHVHATALNIDQRIQNQALSFDTDSSTIICDNSANVHICNNKKMFIGAIRRTDQHYVATIGGNKNNATGMGTARWTWKDDDGKSHTMDINDVLYFPSSPVNILSVTALATQLEDDEGTGIDTKRTSSKFYWDNGKYERTYHPP